MTDRRWIEAMAQHLPPSASTLRLLDLIGSVGAVRPDVAVTGDGAAGGFDAVFADGAALNGDLLGMALRALRPGGRLIAVDTQGEPSAAWVKTLEQAGFTRVLVEELLPTGVLLRGERPHETADTLARVQSVAARDQGAVKGCYVYLLVRQTPNKPVWALRPGDPVEWQALALADADGPLLAFSSLPNAVAFMQPAVLSGQIRDVNKLAKFSRESARDWHLLINPSIDILQQHPVTLVPVDHARAEAPDE